MYRLSELVSRLGGVLHGDDINVYGISSLENAVEGSITFLSNPKFKAQAGTTKAAALIVRPADKVGLSIPCIETNDPYLYFTRVSQLFNPLPVPVPGIHPSAVVAPDAIIDPTVEIGPQVIIESGAKIGSGSIIGAGCVIGNETTIGDNCIFYPRVVVYHHSVVGDRVIVHAGTVIGSDGFGNAWARDHWEKIPQVGRAVIGNDVEIGANVTIDRGALGDTIISSDVRLDNLIHIAHNVEIGRFTAIAACVGIAGSTKIGAGCLIGGGALISGHLTIADRVSISGGCGVTSSIDTPGGTYGSVNPAVPQSLWRRNAVHYRNFDKLVQRIRDLEKKLKSTSGDELDNN